MGVDGGADAFLEMGMTPDVIIGDMDSVSERALRCGAALVVHGYADGRAPGSELPRRAGPRARGVRLGRHVRGHRHAHGLRARAPS